MVDTNTLMRSNALRLYNNDDFQIVDAISEDTIKLIGIGTYLADDLLPIPLTEEIVKQFPGYSDYENQKYIISSESYLAYDFKTIEIYSNAEGQFIKQTIDGTLHNLQNIHLLMSGATLQIKK